ncbi:MAG: DUF3793 family protein [Lachnospiraceae bacterium]|nr:DUF3793 family protein [Lachnospiraceae bacterium]
MVLQNNTEWLNEQIAVQCAPLLAGLKPSNLLIIPMGMEAVLRHSLRGTRIAMYLLSEYDGKQVFLLYKVNELIVYLTEQNVQRLLLNLGYESGELYSLLQRVSKKYTAHKQEKEAFPHELGLLLGYPAVDVKGFMEQAGKNFLYSGYWKVYGNVRETVLLFREFGRAKEYVVRLVKQGYSIAEIMAMYYKTKAIA